jgi:fluoroquinolone transport system ATP-binding protein
VQYGKNTIRVEYVKNGEIETKDFPLDVIGEQAEFFDTMKKYEIRTIHSLEATLEDIFIRITGKELV